MKKQIRMGVFETNSSSTHAISISGNDLNSIPEGLHFRCGEFGWECDLYMDVHTKASYIWTWVTSHFSKWVYPTREDGTVDYTGTPTFVIEDGYSDWKDFLDRVCREVGVKDVTFQDVSKRAPWGFDSGYIDHSSELCEFMTKLWDDGGELLKQFLFCDESGIETGNDNDDRPVSYPGTNLIYTYLKGN